MPLAPNYISADAQTSASKQLADIEGMITQGCSALIILAQDSASIGPGSGRRCRRRYPGRGL